MWLILTLKRDWDFKVMHPVHEIIALQNGPQTMTTVPAHIMEKKPSELKNALILLHGDQIHVIISELLCADCIRFCASSLPDTDLDVPASPFPMSLPFSDQLDKLH
ncbi:unnamed protein product [Gongylonema pulchrum]|uniref:Uncharacterized protein n=1 Tax=Gongylonema pulchrum TaxID=637853 RepID=A0A3P6QY14_9BILA|nr:unnamed protein product [Gongylonema pulchrum]